MLLGIGIVLLKILVGLVVVVLLPYLLGYFGLGIHKFGYGDENPGCIWFFGILIAVAIAVLIMIALVIGELILGPVLG